MSKELRERAFELLNKERERQNELGKVDRQGFASWLIILTDYLGRASNYMWKMVNKPKGTTVEEFRVLLVKALAVGVAWLENVVEVEDLLASVPPSEEIIESEFNDEEDEELKVEVPTNEGVTVSLKEEA